MCKMTHCPRQAPSVSKLAAGSGQALDDCQLAVEIGISDFIVCHIIKDTIWIQKNCIMLCPTPPYASTKTAHV